MHWHVWIMTETLTSFSSGYRAVTRVGGQQHPHPPAEGMAKVVATPSFKSASVDMTGSSVPLRNLSSNQRMRRRLGIMLGIVQGIHQLIEMQQSNCYHSRVWLLKEESCRIVATADSEFRDEEYYEEGWGRAGRSLSTNRMVVSHLPPLRWFGHTKNISDDGSVWNSFDWHHWYSIIKQ